MAVKNTNLGGTDWTDGEVLYGATDLNDTFNAVILHRKVFTAATEQNTDSTSWADVPSGSFTLSANGALITAIILECELSTTNDTDSAYAGLHISGSTLGSKYLCKYNKYINYATTAVYYTHALLDTSEAEAVTLTRVSADGGGYREVINTCIVPLKLVDDTTTFQVRFKSSSAVAGHEAYIKNITVTVVYTYDFKDD